MSKILYKFFSCDDLDATLADVRPARKLALEESHGPLNATDASILLSGKF